MRNLRSLTLAPLVVLAACPGYDARVVEPESVKEVNRVRAGIVPTPADVLFIVDNSGSMAEEQANLAASFDAFIRGVSARSKNDYRLAVITTDAGDVGIPGLVAQPDGAERAGEVTNTHAGAPYHQLLGNDAPTACGPIADIAHSCFRGPDPARRVIDSSMPAAEQLAAFRANVSVGTCGSGNEQGLLSMLAAVGKACNAGFLRPEANLVIVFVSDEEDASPRDRDYLAELLRITGKSASQIRVGAVVGSAGGRAGFCGRAASCGAQVCALGEPANDANVSALWNQSVERPCGWCSLFDAPDCCTALPGRSYIDFANEVEDAVRAGDPNVLDNDCTGTGSGPIACLVDSVCQDDFSQTLERIARELVTTRAFEIAPSAAYVPGVVVELNGERLRNCQAVDATADCDFDVINRGTRVVITNQAKVPGEEDTLAIYYTVAE